MVELIAAGIAIVIGAVFWTANFYLFGQWIAYPRQRRRFQVCKPYLLIGWALYVIGGAVIRQIGRVQNSNVLTGAGTLVAFLGIGLAVHAALRLFRANAAERRASKEAAVLSSSEGVWPPAPKNPTIP